MGITTVWCPHLTKFWKFSIFFKFLFSMIFYFLGCYFPLTYGTNYSVLNGQIYSESHSLIKICVNFINFKFSILSKFSWIFSFWTWWLRPLWGMPDFDTHFIRMFIIRYTCLHFGRQVYTSMTHFNCIIISLKWKKYEIKYQSKFHFRIRKLS